MRHIIIIAAAAAFAACRAYRPFSGAGAEAVIQGARGEELGWARFSPARGGVELEIEVGGLAPGLHGMHVHEAGRCEPPSFESAGGHLNPSGARHGLDSAAGPHTGDMPNLSVRADGTAKARLLLPRVSLGVGSDSLLRPGGASLMIHAGRDDQVSDPSGGSGARLACGVITKGGRIPLKKLLKKVEPVPK